MSVYSDLSVNGWLAFHGKLRYILKLSLGISLDARHSPLTSGQLGKAPGPWLCWNQLEKAGEGWTRLLGLVRPELAGKTLWHTQNTLAHSLIGMFLANPWKCCFCHFWLCTFFGTFLVKCHILQLMSSMTALAVLIEFLALKWAVTDKFKEYLYGENKFEIYTDNNPLTYILTTGKLDACGQRWVADLANFNFTLHYKPGSTNTVADLELCCQMFLGVREACVRILVSQGFLGLCSSM